MSIGDIKALADAVKSEAGRDQERILSHARLSARTLREQARAEAEIEGKRMIQDAEIKAARFLEQARAAAGIEAQALRLDNREALLNRVFDLVAEGLQATQNLEDYCSVVHALIRDAVAHMGNVNTMVVLADPVTRECLDDKILGQLCREFDIELTLGGPLDEGTGLVVQSQDGHLFYDNTFQARLTRMRSSLRALVFQILRGGDR
ncbi:MAG: V-type ATP synthase subunit E family protein [Anaerolineae bacterium]|nr:V-type ATP synthase subunit E family protein [Anaerolineae bacterium]